MTIQDFTITQFNSHHFGSNQFQGASVPNPKRRHSKTRTAKRRTHDALKPVPVGTCPQCQESKAPHQVCPHCGYYKGRQVKAVEEA